MSRLKPFSLIQSKGYPQNLLALTGDRIDNTPGLSISLHSPNNQQRGHTNTQRSYTHTGAIHTHMDYTHTDNTHTWTIHTQGPYTSNILLSN